MDAMIRTIITISAIFLCVAMHAQQMNWSRLAEDTIYYANEYSPDHVTLSPPGPGQVWDFRSLRAPYAISKRIVVAGNSDNLTYAQIFNGKEPEAVLKLNGQSSQLIQLIEDNPICPSGKLTYTLMPPKKTIL